MLSAVLFGVFLGIFSGLMPGIGSGSILLIVFPLLLQLDPTHVLVLYLSLVISSQYVASVTAIYTGIPGAESANPTAKEFSSIRSLGLTHLAIFQNAAVSVLGNVIGIFGFLLLIPFLFDLSAVYQNNIKVGILLLAYTALILTDERKLVAVLCIGTASFLMSLGFNPHTFETVNLGLNFLDSGLSWTALVMGALVGSSLSGLSTESKPEYESGCIQTHYPYIESGVRGSILGFFIGFVPGLSYVLSAILSYSAERRYLLFKAKPKEQVVLGSIAASEAAQSSGTVSMLIPLLVFGIPITVSEGIILNALTITSDLSTIVANLQDKFLIVAFTLLGVNVLSFWLALRSRFLVKLIFQIPTKALQVALVLMGLIAVVLSNEYYVLLATGTYFTCLVVFVLLRTNPLPFIMATLLFSTTQSTFYLFKELL